MGLNKDLREFIALLNSTGVRFLVVGGHAVAFHGYPRFTGDVDFFVERSADNARRLEEALRDFGFGSLGLTQQDFLTPEVVVQLGRPPNRVDIVTSIDGVDFDQAWRNRVEAELDSLPVCFIGRQDLVINKRAAARPQDLADVAMLEGPSAASQPLG